MGTETTLDTRDWNAFPSILSGDIGVLGDSTDNSYTVVYMSYPDSTTVLDGFTIQKGNANYTGTAARLSSLVSGAGLYIMGEAGAAYPLIQHCAFLKNTVLRFGAGICINGDNGGSVAPIIYDCYFEGNWVNAVLTGETGAGIFKRGGSLVERGADIDHCTFVNNKGYGAGIGFEDGPSTDTLQIMHCNFLKNKGRGIHVGQGRPEGSCVSIKYCNFEDNNYGGVLFSYNVPEYKNYKYIELGFCNFKGDVGGGIGVGGYGAFDAFAHIHHLNLINCSSASVSVSFKEYGNVKINDITATNCDFGMYSNILENSTMENISITNCKRVRIGIVGISATINNLLYADNIETSNDSTFGVLSFGQDLNLKITNSTIKTRYLFRNFLSGNNVLGRGNIALTNSAVLFDKLFNKDASSSTLLNINFDHCLLQSDTFCNKFPTVVCGAGNLYGVDPLFSDPVAGNYTPLSCSPLVNAGTNSIILPGSTDLAGGPRIQGGTVDIGAYEAAPFILSAESVAQPACVGIANGSISISTVNACLPVTYTWNSSGGQGTTLDGLAAGTYKITLTDAKNNTVALTVIVPTSPAPQVAVQTTAVLCGTAIGGTATPTITGNYPPFLFNWSNSSKDSILTNLAYGSYALTVTDARGCTGVSTASIGRMGTIQVDIQPTPITCPGDLGGIGVAALNGVAPFTWLWTSGETTSALSGLSEGIYSGMLMDALGCGISWNIPLDAPDSLRANPVVTSATGPNSANGSIVLAPTGGTGALAALWSNGSNGLVLNNLLPGTYTVTLTDSNGCSSEATIVVTWTSGSNEAAISAVQVQIWPNPASEWMTVVLGNGKLGQNPLFRVYNSDGKQMVEMPIVAENSFSVGVSDWTSGVYFWNIISSSDHIAHGQVIKE